ncbi:MAG: hypothetical protein ACLFP8_06435 [Alphaproteobacteria bacterium]
MAAMTPLLATGMTIAMNAASNEQASKQLKEKQTLQETQTRQSAALEKEHVAQESKIDEQQRKAALRRAVASQKANFGAQGVSSKDGSAEAVLLGLTRDSETEQEFDNNRASLKQAAIEQDVSQRKALNILQRTQLQEKNNLSTIRKFF